MAKRKPIKDQVILITGASSEIGLATARTVARAGARVMLVAGGGEALGEIARAINNAGGRADYAVANAGDAAALAAAARAAVARFGRVDTWVDGASAGVDGRPIELPNDEHRAAATVLRETGGGLIIIGPMGLDEQITPGQAALRDELQRSAPGVSVTLVERGVGSPTAGQVAEAVLDGARHRRREVTIGDGDQGATPGFLTAAIRRPGIAAAVGLGGIALVAGGIAALRRRRGGA